MGVEQQRLARQLGADHRDDVAGQAAADGARPRHAAAILALAHLRLEAERAQFADQPGADRVIGVAVDRMRPLVAEDAAQPPDRAVGVEWRSAPMRGAGGASSSALERKRRDQQRERRASPPIAASCASPPDLRPHVDICCASLLGASHALSKEQWHLGYRVAVVGATGNVGREILNILAERQFPLDEVAAVASARSTGDVIDFGDSGKKLKVQNLEHFDFAGWDMALFAAGSEASRSLCARRRRGRLHGDRQQLALPHGPRRAADRARSEPRGDRRLSRTRTSSPTPIARPRSWSWR